MPYKYGYSEDAASASGYYLGDAPISKAEIDSVQRFLQDNHILPENTRVSKTTQGTHPDCPSFCLHIASLKSSWKPPLVGSPTLDLPGNPSISVNSGDFADCLARVIMELRCAASLCKNETALSMLESLIESFESGDHNEFKAAQSHWVRDRSPVVETVIGFIETYQDPHGVRAAWEGIIAIVNKEQSRKFSTLVDNSPQLVPLLPWNGQPGGVKNGQTSVFENKTFIRPDFTSLDSKLIPQAVQDGVI